MNISQMIKKRIDNYEVTEPIFVDEIIDGLSDNHKDAVYVAMNRLTSEGAIVKYSKGIYYKPKISKFGNVGLDKQMLIKKKYIKRNNQIIGYITGPTICNEWGISTQISNRVWVAQNIRQRKFDRNMNVMLIKAKGEIKQRNIKALQFLDIIDQMDYIQDTNKEDIVRKLTVIYRDEFEAYDKIAVLEEVRKYNKKVKILFGLIAEKTEINDEYFHAMLMYLKEDVQKGKKIILDIDPKIFKFSRAWGNGYVTSR